MGKGAVFLLVFWVSLGIASTPTLLCRDILKDAVEQSLDTRIATIPWYRFIKRRTERLNKVLFSNLIVEELERSCPNFGACSVSAQQEAVTKAIDRVYELHHLPPPSRRNLAIFLGAITTQSVLTTIFVRSLPPIEATVFSSLTASLAMVIVNSLSSSILERIANAGGKQSYSARDKPRNPMELRYEALGLSLKQTLSNYGMLGRTSHRAVLNNLIGFWLQNRADMKEYKGNSEGLREVALFNALWIYDFSQSMFETELRDPWFRRHIQRIFAKKYITAENYAEFLKYFEEAIREYVPEGSIEKYMGIIEYWCKPNLSETIPDGPQLGEQNVEEIGPSDPSP